jgi:Protein of unknown function (DUF5131)
LAQWSNTKSYDQTWFGPHGACGRSRAVAAAEARPVAGLLISGGESGGGVGPLNRQWVRDIIADCHAKGVAPFHKQWGTFAANPLVIEQGMTTVPRSLTNLAREDGQVDGKPIREFPLPIR